MSFNIINSTCKSLDIRHIYVPHGTYIFEYHEDNTYFYSKKNREKMFRQNDQPSLITFEAGLSEKQRKLLDRSKEKWFTKLILRIYKQ